MTYEQIRKIIETGENIGTEFKRCGNGIESDTYETVCSFSNRFGGDILFGVFDDGTVNGLPEIIEYENKKNIHIHVPVSSEVHTYKKIIYDRINDSDVKVSSTSRIAALYIRKQNIFTEQKVYKYVQLEDLRADIISLCRQRAINKRSDHPWKNLSDIDLLKSAKLFSENYETGEKGFNLAAVLLLEKTMLLVQFVLHIRLMLL